MKRRRKVKITIHRPERDRMMFKLLQRISELNPSEAVRGTTVSSQTITNWRKPLKAGGTRFPQFATMSMVAKANGLEFVMREVGEPARPSAGYSAHAVHAPR